MGEVVLVRRARYIAKLNALRSPISLLEEFYQRTGGIVKFDTNPVAGSMLHTPLFECKLTLPGREEPFIGVGKNKKDAETAAAAQAITAENIAERTAALIDRRKEVAPDPDKNPRSLLYELAQSCRWPKPVFDTQRTGGHQHSPYFTSTLTIKGVAGEGEEELTFTGQGPKVKIAENNAALQALQHLAPWQTQNK